MRYDAHSTSIWGIVPLLTGTLVPIREGQAIAAALDRIRTAPRVAQPPAALLHVAAVATTIAGTLGLAVVLGAVGGHPPGDALGAMQASLSEPYRGAVVGGEGAYLYSPAFLQFIAPFRDAGWFVDAWRALEGGAFVLLAGPLTLPLLLLEPVVLELRLANINILLGLAMALGFRWPAAWAFVLLTKVTPGVGLVWFAVRREWRNLGIALVATIAIVGLSWLADPAPWLDWLGLLFRSAEAGQPMGFAPVIPAHLSFRLATAAALVAWGAQRGRRWTVVVAGFVALPVTWPTAISMLVAVIPLLAWPRITEGRRAAGGITAQTALRHGAVD